MSASDEVSFSSSSGLSAPVPPGLERRMRKRLAEADSAAATARFMLKTARWEDTTRLDRTVRHHEALAEALRDVLTGDF